MSRLTDLLRSVESTDPQTAAELRKEIMALTHNQRTFGLVYEKHQPEAVQLPGIKIRKGSKVNILPERGSRATRDKQLWKVESINRDNSNGHLAQLIAINPGIENPEDLPRTEALVENLVAVLEFHDRIFPGLIETGRVERGGDSPFHSVINAENFHALEMLTYTHRHKIDAIYIDPPYNTGAKDWKYNNDYVDGDDAYRHSKWLSFMERRLKIAKELLNPDDSVLIVTIDEKEYLRLGMLLEQIFPEARIQMVSVAIHSGVARAEFSRTDEFYYFVKMGISSPKSLPLGPEWKDDGKKRQTKVRWESLLRSGNDSKRQDRPSMFYPVFLEEGSGKLIGFGESLSLDEKVSDYAIPEGVVAVFPYSKAGEEARWRISASKAEELHSIGAFKVGKFNGNKTTFSYLKAGELSKVHSGEYHLLGYDANGAMVINSEGYSSRFIPGTQWNVTSHNAGSYGTELVNRFLVRKRFDYPKSLYAVEDSLRFFVADKPNAIILDFFAGSGTTAHAVMRLNRQDGGKRVSISVTNNEVSIDEQKSLIGGGLRPGDSAWEQYGICEYVTKPRITAAITGRTPEGELVKGDYKFIDEFPMAEGFEANAAFFTLTYESSLRIRHNKAFQKIAPLLWLRAGSQGRIIENLGENGWDIADKYAVIENLDQLTEFSQSLGRYDVSTVFIVTDDNGAFEMAVRSLPESIETVRLYSSYLENFEINSGRSF